MASSIIEMDSIGLASRRLPLVLMALRLASVSGQVHTLSEVCDVIRERAAVELGRNIKFVEDPALFRPAGSKMGESAVVSSLKFTQRFGWGPKIGIAEGIARTLREGVGDGDQTC